MREELFLGGMGGQGVLLGGQMVARAAMDKGLSLSWFPIYSPEVRGGYTTCTVIISDGRVGSPLSEHPGSMIIMDPVALRLFGDRAPAGGLMVLNSSLIEEGMARPDVRTLWVPANEIAAEVGSDRTVNMAMIGAWAAATGVLTIEEIAASLLRMLPERHHRFMPVNEEALRRGAQAAGA